MDSIIESLEGRALSGTDMMRIMENQTKVLRYPEIYDFKNLDDLFKPFDNVILLYETKPNYGHWVCLIRHQEGRSTPYIEFFDSYGMEPDEQLEHIKKDFRRRNNEDYPKLTEMMAKSGYKVIYNSTKLQKDRNNVSTCGRHVAFRLTMRDLPLERYLKMMKGSRYNPDMIVTFLTAFI